MLISLRFLLLLILLLPVPNFLLGQTNNAVIHHGTSIVTVTCRDTIWIAADSKETSEENNIIQSKSVCKIFTENGISYASTANVALYYRNIQIFSAEQIIRKALKKATKSPNDVYLKCNIALTKAIKTAYSIILPTAAKTDITDWFNRNSGKLLEVTIVYFNKEEPINLQWSYYLTGNTSSWQVKDTITKFMDGIKDKVSLINSKNYMVFLFAGSHFKILKFLQENRSFTKYRVDIPRKLIQLIKMEIDGPKSPVGLPIEVKVLTPYNSKWLTPHTYCKQ